jgi:methylated-DNA-[protein]-cysteine S-methyltransferase
MMVPRGTAGRRVAYDVVDTPFGWVGVVVGPRGLRRVVLPAGPRAALERVLRSANPGARRDPRRCRRAAGAIRRYIRTGRAGGAGSLDLGAATPLARAVYAALARTAAGDVLTYGGLARRIGRPRAARAVGRALSRNPVPLVIPCHRVVRAGGGLGGFSCPGGLRLKRRLLDFERGVSHVFPPVVSPRRASP